MAHVDTRHTASTAQTAGLLGRVANAFKLWNEKRATRAALSKLSDRELSDIGIARSDIEHISAGH